MKLYCEHLLCYNDSNAGRHFEILDTALKYWCRGFGANLRKWKIRPSLVIFWQSA